MERQIPCPKCKMLGFKYVAEGRYTEKVDCDICIGTGWTSQRCAEAYLRFLKSGKTDSEFNELREKDTKC